MVKKIIQRGSLGILIGIIIQLLIGIIISVTINDGKYYAVSPQLIETFSTEINAVIMQVILSGLYGFIYATTSLIWENSWSIAMQTATAFFIYLICFLPIALLLKWLPADFLAIIIFIAIFTAIFIFIWIFSYFTTKAKVKQLNKKRQG